MKNITDNDNDKWAKEQIFQGEAKTYGVAYTFGKSRVRVVGRRKAGFWWVMVVLGTAVIVSVYNLVGTITNVSSGNASGLLVSPSRTFYSLELGIVQSYEVATMQADAVVEAGGAGFIWNEDGYHIVAQIYQSQDDVDKVIAKMDTLTYSPSSRGLYISETRYDGTLTESDSEILIDAYALFYDSYESLFDIVVKYDTKEDTISASQLKLVQLRDDFRVKLTRFGNAWALTERADIIKLNEALEQLYDEIEVVADPIVTESSFSALVKHASVTAIYHRMQLTK